MSDDFHSVSVCQSSIQYSTFEVDSFEQNYSGAKSAGLHVGAYWYSYAQSIHQAENEAAACIKTLRGKQFDFPIFFDLEEQDQFKLGIQLCSRMVSAFCSSLEKAGFFAGLYMSRYYLENFITPDVRNRYTLWIAEYSSLNRYSGPFGIWQYGSGSVPGVPAQYDLNYSYIDYPRIIINGGFNGYISPVTPVAPQNTIKAGDTVRIKNGAKSYDGQGLAPFVYGRSYRVSELKGGRAVVTYNGTVVAAVNVNDLFLE